jgi:cupin 2 domain-containing protein
MAQDKNAANDGDLLKHALLTEVLGHCAHWHSLTYAETHAGAGIYMAQNQTGGKPYIKKLRSTIAELAEQPIQQAGGQYTSLLKNWWMEAGNEELYPGSAYQAVTLLRTMGNKEVVFRVTENCGQTYSRLKTALGEFGIMPEFSGFQFKIDWLTENDPLVLIIDPFAYAADESGLPKGQIDLGTLHSLLNSCWQKRACLVGFWCAAPHSAGSIRRATFEDSLKVAASNNKAALRTFKFGQFSMAWIGIGIGKQVVTAIPATKRWMNWLRRVVKEDLANEVAAVSDPINLFAALPTLLTDEHISTLLDAASIRIERIISHGHASPEDFWFDQEQHEWIVVLKGAARLRFEDWTIEMKPGDSVNIPAHRKHRVEWTTPDEQTIWLVVHYEDHE